MSGRIPEGYTLLEQKFMKAVRHARREWKHEDTDLAAMRGPGVQLSEWEREGWTYHAKGRLFFTLPLHASTSDAIRLQVSGFVLARPQIPS